MNIDIARTLGLGYSIQDGLDLLNAMEVEIMKILDFNMFVSEFDYNKVQNNINEKIRKAKAQESIALKQEKLSKK